MKQKPDEALARLAAKFIGTWKLSGEATGSVHFEWYAEGLFLKQEFDITVFGQRNIGVEIIGRLRLPNQKPSKEIWSRAYITPEGQTFDYVYELRGNVITIWFGEKGASNCFRGRFSADGKSYEGAWQWPGGGYQVVATKLAKQRRKK